MYCRMCVVHIPIKCPPTHAYISHINIARLALSLPNCFHSLFTVFSLLWLLLLSSSSLSDLINFIAIFVPFPGFLCVRLGVGGLNVYVYSQPPTLNGNGNRKSRKGPSIWKCSTGEFLHAISIARRYSFFHRFFLFLFAEFPLFVFLSIQILKLIFTINWTQLGK